MDKTLLTVKVVMLKGEKGEKGDGVYDDSEVRQQIGFIDEYLEHIPYVEYEEDGDFVLPTHTINDNETSTDSTWSSRKIIDMIYPVGAIFMSANSANPSTYLGGTWVAWGSGRVPVGVDTSQTEFDTVEETGGAKTHTLTVNEMPKHNHVLIEQWITTEPHVDVAMPDNKNPSGLAYPLSLSFSSPFTDETGGNAAHNNLQPYITCYMWKRTA